MATFSINKTNRTSAAFEWHSRYSNAMPHAKQQILVADLFEVTELLADATAAYVRARNDGGVSMADLSSIADRKLREANELWQKFSTL